MSDWCSCNPLREAQEKAAKWDAIVRCGECENGEPSRVGKRIAIWCNPLERNFDINHFCAWGWRKGE